MEVTSLKKLYSSVNDRAKTIYVVPLIRYSHQKSDYLYLLYKKLIEEDEFTLRSISVYDHYKLVIGILRSKQAILHYHWLEFQDLKSLLGMPFKLLCIFLFKLLGGNIVWTIHNKFPHDQRYLKLHKIIHTKMAKWADAIHVHCEAAGNSMVGFLKASPDKFKIIPHPVFPAESIDVSKARENLKTNYNCELPEQYPVALMFGNISYYKQIEKVAKIIIDKELSCTLLIAGPVKKGNLCLYEELTELCKRSDKIHMIPQFIPEEQVSWFYSAADFCIFNYREILSSGGYHMAQAYNKPVIAPALGCLSEEGDKPNVSLFNKPEELTSLILNHIKSCS